MLPALHYTRGPYSFLENGRIKIDGKESSVVYKFSLSGDTLILAGEGKLMECKRTG